MPIPIVIVQGAQFGSEGKGGIAAYLCQERNIAVAVRTGSINAGHTVYYRGEPYKMQQLPTGWVNPQTQLVIGPGAYIHLETLKREIAMVNKATGGNVEDRLYIDSRCGLHQGWDEVEARHADRHTSIGATGKGCAEAIIRKIRDRGTNDMMLFRHLGESNAYDLVDTTHYLMHRYNRGHSILIEGTQGAELDFHLGPYPYVTSRMTSSANWIAECGLSPALQYEIVLVARTYPIRVAGNSGPMFGEMSWPEVARSINDRLGAKHLPALVKEEAIVAFEDIARAVAQSYSMPLGSDGLDQHTWTPEQRIDHRVALSRINAEALALVKSETPAMYDELTKLFEFTTVTQKLRRIGDLDTEALRQVIMRERPSRLVFTFLNYVFPETWGMVDQPLGGDILRWLKAIESSLGGTPIDLVTTGPRPEHIFKPR